MKIGSVFEKRYFVSRLLGRGGMGCVYLCFDIERFQFVAIKTLFSELSQVEEYLMRLTREYRIYRTLNHPNIVSVVGADLTSEPPYMALEFVSGKPLTGFIGEDNERLSLHQILRYTGDLAGALALAHDQGIIHRDIKPANIVLNQDGCVKLIDFGVADVEDSLIETKTGMMVGTRCYAAPEQNQGQTIDHRVDLYSLGVTMWELMTGRRLFKEAGGLGLISQQFAADFPPPSTYCAGVSPQLDALVMSLLSPSRDDRPDSAGELRSLIEEERRSIVKARRHGVSEYWFEAYHRALQFVGRAELAEAQNILSRIERAETTAEVQFLLGKIAWRRKLKFKALEHVNKAITLEPSNMLYRTDVIRILLSFNMYNQARKTIEEAIVMAPDDCFIKTLAELFARRKQLLAASSCTMTDDPPGSKDQIQVSTVKPDKEKAPRPQAVPGRESQRKQSPEQAAMDTFIKASRQWRRDNETPPSGLPCIGDVLLPFSHLSTKSGSPLRGVKSVIYILLLLTVLTNVSLSIDFSDVNLGQYLLDIGEKDIFLSAKEKGLLDSFAPSLTYIDDTLSDYFFTLLFIGLVIVYFKACVSSFWSSETGALFRGLSNDGKGIFAFSFVAHPLVKLDKGTRLLVISSKRLDNLPEEQVRHMLFCGQLNDCIAGSLIVTSVGPSVAKGRVDLVSIPLPPVGSKGWCCPRSLLSQPKAFLKSGLVRLLSESGEE